MCVRVCTYVYIVNRRMDEWIPVCRVDVKRGVVDETPKEKDTMLEINGRERKVTRNLKRKHDEINHIQKVCTWCTCVCAQCGRLLSSTNTGYSLL